MIRARITIAAVAVLALVVVGRSEEGAAMPLPFGLGVTLFQQQQDYDVDTGVVSLGGVIIPLDMVPGVGIQSDLTEINLRLDQWVLPYFNVFGLVGVIDGTTRVNAPLDVVMGPGAGTVPLDLEYDGLVLGGGATLAVGTAAFFGTLTATYTVTDLDISDSSITAITLSPKVGYVLEDLGEDKALTFWVGAMMQEVQENQAGSIVLPVLGGLVMYDVELKEQDAWNGLAGLSLHASKEWSLELEAGFGTRQHALLAATRRF